MCRIPKLTFLLALLTTFSGQGRAAPEAPRDSLYLEVDYGAFRLENDSSNSYVEVYYNLRRNQLRYEPAEVGYVAFIDFTVTVRKADGNLFDSLSWTGGSKIEALSVLEDTDYMISDLLPLAVPAGQYRVTLKAANAGRIGQACFEMDVPGFDQPGLTLSSIELAYKAVRDTVVGKFTKAGAYRVILNPSDQFPQDNDIIYVYAEGYNFRTPPEGDSQYTVALTILDKDGKVYRSIPPSVYKKPGESAVILTGFSIVTMAPGRYTLRLGLTDGASTAEVTKDFLIVASRQRLMQAAMQSVLADFPESDRIETEEDAKRFRDLIFYIATPDELRMYDALDLAGKAKFQKKFWESRDPDPSTPVNEFQVEHCRRFKHANEAFGRYQGNRPGWRTDMGRIYILYGEPSEIERHPSSLEARSWERWWYHGLEGGVFFIFVDMEDSGAYTLIHSSKQNELKDYNWESKIKMTIYQR